MNNSTNKNPSFRPGQREVDEITKRARKGGRDGAVLGGVGGYVAGAFAPRGLRKARLAGAGVGAGVGYIAGKTIGRKVAAKDDIASRKALREMAVLSAIDEKLTHLETRAKYLGFETIDGATAMKPRSRSGQHPVPIFPKSKRRDIQQTGIDDEGDYQLTEERQALADEFGWGIVSQLPDEMLTREHAAALRDQVLGRQSQANGPRAGGDRDPSFERHVLTQHLGERAVSEMSDALVHCNYLGAVRKGLIELDDQSEVTSFEILNRTRTSEGTFAPDDQVSSQAVQRAYHVRDRKTGIEPGTGALAAGAASVGALALLRARKGKRARLTGGSTPKLGFSRGDNDQQGHGVRNAAIAAGVGALGAAALLRRRKAKLRLPLGVPKIDNAIDVETSQVMSRRIPVLTSFVKGPGSYIIRRATLRGKKPPTGVHPRHLGKAKKHSLAFLIHDPDFPLLPMKQPKLAPGMKQRVPVAKTRAEVLRRLKALTQLSRHEFAGGLGKVAAEGLIDATGIGSLAGETPAQRRARQTRIAQQQAAAAADNDPSAQPRTLDSALDRLSNMDFSAVGRIGSVAGKYLPEAAVIGSADLVAERANAAIEARKKRQKRLVRQSGGVQATPSMGGAPTTMSAIVGTLNEFSDDSRNRARKRAGELGAAGVGGTAGAIAGLKHDPGVPIRTGDLQPGMRVTKRFGPGGLFQHVGVVDESGRVVHRTSGSSKLRSVAPSTFQKTGKGPLRHEVHADDLPPRQAAANASRATGTRAGRYSACQGNNCQDAAERLISRGKPVSRQLRKAIGGAAIGAAGLGSVAHILGNRRKDK